MRPLLGGFLSTCLLCWAQQPESVPRQAAVTIRVSTTFGEPVSKAVVTLRSATGSVRRETLTGEVTLQQIEYGDYSVQVEAAGFAIRRERLEVQRPSVELLVGLNVSARHGQQRSELVVTVSPLSANGDLWVRVVPLYFDTFLEQRVGGAGSARFVLPGAGRYAVLVFDQNRILALNSIDCHEGLTRLDAQLPPKAR